MKRRIKDLFRKAQNKLFRRMLESAYPDGAKFLNQVREWDLVYPNSCPTFSISANLASKGFLSALSCDTSIARDVMLQEVDNALREKGHGMDVSGVSVDGFHENGNFVLKFTFGNLAAVDEGTDD